MKAPILGLGKRLCTTQVPRNPFPNTYNIRRFGVLNGYGTGEVEESAYKAGSNVDYKSQHLVLDDRCFEARGS